MVRVAVSDRVDGYDGAWQPVTVCTFAEAMEIVAKMRRIHFDFELEMRTQPVLELESFAFYRSESAGFELRLEVRE